MPSLYGGQDGRRYSAANNFGMHRGRRAYRNEPSAPLVARENPEGESVSASSDRSRGTPWGGSPGRIRHGVRPSGKPTRPAEPESDPLGDRADESSETGSNYPKKESKNAGKNV